MANEVGMTKTMAPYQEFFEQGVGDETLGSRMLGTITQGKLFEAPSSGFGQEFAAENIPILQDMDPISRGVYNAVAPYGEKAFDILDTAYRLGGAAVADIAQLAGVDEDDVNEIQSAVNTAIGFFIPKGNPLMTSQATNQAVGSVLKGVNAVKNDPLIKVMTGSADSGFRLSAGGGKTSVQDFKKLVEAKRPGGTIFEIGEEGTEGTFRYRGETYNKADGILIGYPSKRAGRDFEKNWVPKKVIEEPNVQAMKEGAKAGLEGKRLKNIDQYATLKDNMLKNNLTFEEAVVEAAGKELKRSTKNYQIVGKFYRIADEMKKVNPELHAFFENQVKAYQIGNEVGGKFKKVRFGTKEYEEARIKLAEKLNIDVKNIDRAHSIMQSRLTKLSKLVEDGVITSEQYNRLAKPQYFLLNADNLKHVGLENKLDELLQRKKKFLDEGDTKSANRVQRGDIIELEDGTKRVIEGIDDITKKMEKLGVESELFDPIKKLIKVFGRRPDAVELYKKAKEAGIKKREGGMMSIFDMTGPLDA
mgnify:FL=1